MNSRRSIYFLLSLALLFCSSSSLAAEQEANYGGVFLEFPQGRFQENAAPNFFKWNLQTRTTSITLKVLRCETACTLDSKKELVARFDFLSDVQSMNWFGEALPVGNYIWSVEGFDKSKTEPVFSDTATFTVEPILSFGYKTNRIGIMAGAGRGDYSSGNNNYDIKFRTTPTTYGLSYGGGSRTAIWNAKAFMSDFILKGQIDQTITASFEYLWQLNVTKPKKILYFLGPSLKYFNYPEILSANGIDLDIKNKFIVSPGFALRTQFEVDKYMAVQFGASYDVAVAGSEDLDFKLDNGSLNTSVGLTYGKMWPVGIGCEVQYQRDRILTAPDASGSVAIRQNQWIFLLHLFYAI